MLDEYCPSCFCIACDRFKCRPPRPILRATQADAIDDNMTLSPFSEGAIVLPLYDLSWIGGYDMHCRLLIAVALFTSFVPFSDAAEAPTRAYFGDTHLHTSFSPDAGMAGTTVGPNDAYRRIGNTYGLLRVDILAACVDWTC